MLSPLKPVKIRTLNPTEEDLESDRPYESKPQKGFTQTTTSFEDGKTHEVAEGEAAYMDSGKLRLGN